MKYWQMLSGRVFIKCALLLILAVFALPAIAQLSLNIYHESPGEHTIAVIPFAVATGQEYSSIDIAEVIAADLSRYGPFVVLPRTSMISLPVSPAEIVRSEWRSRGVEFMVVGEIFTSALGLVKVQWHLVDLIRNEILSSGVTEDEGDGERAVAHKLAAKVHTAILGTKGPYQAKLAFVRRDGSQPFPYRLVLADIDGKERKDLWASADPILSPDWDPRGRRVAFSVLSADGQAVYILDSASGEVSKLGNWKWDTGSPAFSATGHYLAVSMTRFANRDVFIYDLRTEKLVRVTDHFAVDTEPSFSQDGTNLLFTSDRSGTPQIYHFNLLTGAMKRLSKIGNYNARGRFIGSNNVVFVHSAVSKKSDSVDKSAPQTSNRHIALSDLRGNILRLLDGDLKDESVSQIPGTKIVTYTVADPQGQGVKFVGFDYLHERDIHFENVRGDVSDPVWWNP